MVREGWFSIFFLFFGGLYFFNFLYQNELYRLVDWLVDWSVIFSFESFTAAFMAQVGLGLPFFALILWAFIFAWYQGYGQVCLAKGRLILFCYCQNFILIAFSIFFCSICYKLTYMSYTGEEALQQEVHLSLGSFAFAYYFGVLVIWGCTWFISGLMRASVGGLGRHFLVILGALFFGFYTTSVAFVFLAIFCIEIFFYWFKVAGVMFR